MNNSFAYNLVKNNQKELFDLFEKLNIYTYSDNEGRLYPISESSQSVYNILTEKINNIEYITINEINKINNKYYKTRGILRRTIEKNKFITKVYCSIYNLLRK